MYRNTDRDYTTMNIDEKLNNMRPKDTPLLVVGYIILAMCLLIPLTATADDNVISLDQEGAELFLRIGQQGDGNDINVDLGLNYAKADNLNLVIPHYGERLIVPIPHSVETLTATITK